MPNLQPNTSYTLSFNRPDDDPVFFKGSDNVFRNYSIVASNGSDRLVVQTQDGGAQSLSAPVVLVTSDDCLYTAPSQPDATPTDMATPTSMVIPDTPTSTAVSTPNPSPTATIGAASASYKVYLAVVMRR